MPRVDRSHYRLYRDTVVFVENARLFADKLQSISTKPVMYAELPGAQHAFDLFHSLRFERVVDATDSFAGWVRSREKCARRSSNGRR